MKYKSCLALVVIFLLFQNCSKAPDSNSANHSAESKPQKFASESFQKLLFASDDGLWNFTVNFEKKLAFVTMKDKVSWFCPPESEWNNLKSILGGAEVCAAEKVPEGTVCTMIYEAPYAKFISSALGELPLGGKISGCQKGSDLCGGSSQSLQQWISMIGQSWRQWTCPQ